VAGRFEAKNLLPYIAVQVAGGLLGAVVILVIASGGENPPVLNPDAQAKAGTFATNGYDGLSPKSFTMAVCFLTEAVLTFMFLIIILGSTDKPPRPTWPRSPSASA